MKIKELTFYLIEKDKQIEEQKKVNQEQQSKNEQEDARMAALEKTP